MQSNSIKQRMRTRDLHRDYYRDRFSEDELCRDFPGDELFIRGLNTMQVYMWNNGVNIDIPVVRVMNTAHFLAAYMFSTTCSGDQLEYDALADMSLGRDKQLFRISIIVLAAMLKRTEGFRAKQCRNMLLENRDPDFDEGVTLYDRFLRSAEERFAEEDFLIDTQQLIKQVNEQKEIIAQQNKEISSLKYTITTMAGQKPQTIVYNYGTYNDIHDNPNATIYACPDSSTAEEVKPVESSSVSPELYSEKTISLPFLNLEKFKELNLYSLEEFEDKYRKAVKGGAPQLAKFLKQYKELNVLNLKDYNKRETYDELKEFFGEDLDFGYPNFAAYY